MAGNNELNNQNIQGDMEIQNEQSDWKARREQRMKEITERLEVGVKQIFTTDMYKDYLNTMGKFHRYSFKNSVLIAVQRPDATLVAGYDAWEKKFNRHVKRGEKGIQIFAPAPVKERRETEKVDPDTNEPVIGTDGTPEKEVVEVVVPRFRIATVFDVSQTYGEELPHIDTPELLGSIENYDVFMEAVRQVSPVPIRFGMTTGDLKGYYHNADKEIVIREGMSELQTMKTAVHEVAHAKLHDRDIMQENGEQKDKMTKEVEAESVAYTVCQYFGLDTSDYSFPYIAGWSSDRDMEELRLSMENIRRTAGEMIENMTSSMQRLMEDPQQLKENEAGLEMTESPERYQNVELFDVPALFSNGRVEEGSLPEGIFSYDLRGADFDPGYPLTVENHVAVNHAATVLTAVPIPMPENGRLRLGNGLNFTGGEQTIEEYLQKMEGKDLALEREMSEAAIGYENENLYLSGKDDRYAIYQISRATKGREYQFMGTDYIKSHNMTVDAADYQFVYGGKLSGQDTLDSIYEKFNIDHPAGYTGHSLSMSDVIVMQKDGETKAYYVDSLGFTDLPDFVPQRLHEADMIRKREDSLVTLDTSGIEIEQHEGQWHTVDKMEIQDEIFYLMQNNEYGDSAAAVILNSDGDLVAQELKNGFDRGAMEAIREYLADKGIAWEPDLKDMEEKTYPPVYRESLTYAREHAEKDAYFDSKRLNIACKEAVELAIRGGFDGMRLDEGVADSVLEEFGGERLSYVLACTVQYKPWDRRFSNRTKEWAEEIPILRDDARGMDIHLDYVIESHPAVLDGFIEIVRGKIGELEQEERKDLKSFVAKYYVVNDAYGEKAEREYQYFQDLDSALTAYAALPNHLDKQIGMESTENTPSQMPLINCRNGIGELNDIKSVSLSGKWVNAETEEALKQANAFLKEHDPEIAYQMGKQYFFIQAIPEGYDYTFYNADFSDIDGGILDRPGLPIRRAINEIVEDFAGDTHPPLKVIDAAEFREKVDAMEKEAIEQGRKLLTAEKANDGTGASEHREPKISFYVAECMEFPSVGECHENIATLQEAMEIYRQIPANRLSGIKGIGFCLDDGSDYDGNFELMSAGIVRKDIINEIPHYKESPLVQQAIADMEMILEKERSVELPAEPVQKEPKETATNEVPGEKVTLKGEKRRSVLEALRERQAKLKEQEKKQETQAQKKGEQEL